MGKMGRVGSWGIVVGLASLAGLIADCGGGASPGAQFCQSWASAFCQKVYACTPADMRGTDFLGGSSESQCTSIWNQSCAAAPPADTTFDVNCSGGAQVNAAAKTACLNELSSISCDDFTAPTYQSVCDQVCGQGTGGAAGATGPGSAGNSGDGGTAGAAGASGAAGTSGGIDAGAPTDPLKFCELLNEQTCALAFNCVPAASRDSTFVGTFGSSVAECQGSKTQALCANATCMPSYDPTAGASCIAIYALYTCADVANGLPADCMQACQIAGNGGSGGAAGTSGGAGIGGTAGGQAGTGGASGGHPGTAGTSGSAGAGGAGGVSPGANIITNGDFSNGLIGWGLTTDTGTLAGQMISNGQLCMTLGTYTTVTLGFPGDLSGAFALTGGVSYQISYQASTTVSVGKLEVKLGSDLPPYTQTEFLTDADVPGSAPLTFTHQFSVATTDPQAGLAFNIVSGPSISTTVCVANVSLVALN
jgi:hypothetical protein